VVSGNSSVNEIKSYHSRSSGLIYFFVKILTFLAGLTKRKKNYISKKLKQGEII